MSNLPNKSELEEALKNFPLYHNSRDLVVTREAAAYLLRILPELESMIAAEKTYRADMEEHEDNRLDASMYFTDTAANAISRIAGEG